MRLFLAIKAFFKILFNYKYRTSVLAITDGSQEKAKELQARLEEIEKALAEKEQVLSSSQETIESQNSDIIKLSAREKTLSQELEQAQEALESAQNSQADMAKKIEDDLSNLREQLETSLENLSLAQAKLQKVVSESAKGPAILLSLLQREGRLIDFMMEDIADFEDDQIGAAVRPVHSGCRKVFEEYVQLSAIQKGDEGDRITVKEGFDPSQIRLTGKVKGEPPFKGTLQHHGWIINELNLPSRPDSHKAEVIAPAEVEIG